MKTPIKTIVILLLAAVLGIGVSACRNTAQGIGKDTEKIGEKIQEKTK